MRINHQIILVGIPLESHPFLMSRFFNFFDYLSFRNFFKWEYTILIKTITYSHNTMVVFKLGNNRLYISSFLVSEEEVERTFSLIPRFFVILTKNPLNVLANTPSSWINFMPSAKVNQFFDFILLTKIGFNVFQNLLESVKLLM